MKIRWVPVGGKQYLLGVWSDITDRKKAEQKAVDAAKFSSENPYPVLRIANDGLILYANPASASLLKEWKCTVGTFAPERWRQFVSEVSDSGSVRRTELIHHGKVFAFRAVPVLDGYVNLYGVDITDRKRADEALKKLTGTLETQIEERTALVRLLQDVADIANAAVFVDDAFRAALDRICRHMDWPLGHAWIVEDGDPETLVDTGVWNLESPKKFSDFIDTTEGTKCQPGADWAARVMTSAKPRWLSDLKAVKDCQRCKKAAAMGLEAALAIPVMVGDRVAAVLEFFSARQEEPDEQLLRVMARIGTQLGRVLERRQLQQQLIDAVWHQQRRFGQELHDGLCQQVAGIGMLAEILAAQLKDGSTPQAATATTLLDAVQTAKEQVSALARALHPVKVDAEALSYALEELAASTEALYGAKCLFKYNKSARLEDNNCANHLFRIAQEAVRNAAKHSRATRIDVSLQQGKRWLTLEVRDNGVGIDTDKLDRTGGVGLKIMQYRAQTINAKLNIRSRDRGGTVVTCRLRRSKKEN
ncbi:MAG: GAF domain-containing sensor histidine kinase [Planctomycetota bacterium]|jgi:signal transduction histidine kinase/PAS domain-containing protein